MIEEERRRERDRRASRSARAGVASRVVSMAVRLLVVPLSIGLLGPERYGLWASVWSFISWLALSEAGVGVGLVNALARARGAEDPERARSHVATAFTALLGVGAVLTTAAVLFAMHGPVGSLLGVSGRSDLTSDARAMLAAAGLVMGLTLVANVVPQALSALQEQYVGSYGAACASVGVLLALLAMRAVGVGPAGFALALGLPPVLANGVLGVDLLWRRHRELRFSLAMASRSSFKEIMGRGGLAFFIQLGELAMVQVANVLIANRLGPKEVTPYAVTFSLLYAGMYFVNFLVQPLWAAYAEAWARGDAVWVRQRSRETLRRVLLLTAAGLSVAAVLGRVIIRVWAGEAAVPGWALLLAMCAFFLCWTVANCVGVLASGLGLFGRRGVVVALTSAWFVAGVWVLLPRWGVAAVPCVGITVVGLQGMVAWWQARRKLWEGA